MININNSYSLKNNYNNICNLKNVSVYLKSIKNLVKGGFGNDYIY